MTVSRPAHVTSTDGDLLLVAGPGQVKVQQPARGTSTVDGPDRRVTTRSTARSDPFRVAWILRSGSPGPPATRATQRILFP